MTPPLISNSFLLGPCSISVGHQPAHRTLEVHHVVPVAWQLRTPVATPPAPGRDPAGRGQLWDARTVRVCPTHHRNVHYWLVQMMKAVLVLGAGTPEAELPVAAFGSLDGVHRRTGEAHVALDGLQRFQPFGSLLELAQVGELGYA